MAQRRVRIGVILSYSLGFAALLALAWLVFLVRGTFSQEWTDRTKDWQAFNRDEVLPYFKLPSEAAIVDAQEMSGLMEGGFRVRFTLPNTQVPKVWLRQIALASSLELLHGRVSEHLYEAPGDTYTLAYNPSNSTYTAEWQWD